MKIFKKLLLNFAILFGLLLFSFGCSNEIIRFENDITDSDAKSRVQWALHLYNTNKINFYTKAELNTLIDDLHFITKENAEETAICDLYASSCKKLITAIDENSKEQYESAFADFVKAQEEYDKYIFKAY